MIDKNTKIEQLIYTAGGTHESGKDSGNFGVWSCSDGLKDLYLQRDLINFAQIVREGNKENYNTKYRNIKQLKSSAKPNLFGKYKEKDYEYIRQVVSNKIDIFEQSTEQSLKFACDYDADFRDNPENAPYRIGATTLLDGRLVVCRINWINRIFSDRDTRTGNFFQHFYVFPKGTKIEDIDISKLNFKLGLEKKYWGTNAEVAPETIPTQTYEEITRGVDPYEDLFNMAVEFMELKKQISVAEDEEDFDLSDQLEAKQKSIKKQIKQNVQTLDLDILIERFSKRTQELKESIIKEAEAKGNKSARISGVHLKDPRYKAAEKIVISAKSCKEKNKGFEL